MEAKPKYKPRRKKPFTRGRFRKKVCRFCAAKSSIDYKNVGMLKSFTSERGKIIPRRITGNCALHQRRMAIAIKRAREIGLLSVASA
ncbi:MAG: 30S ribosomal protein S18 [bacterium]